MASVSASRTLDAFPDQVFSFVTDPRNFGAYVDGYLSGRTLTEHASGPGAVYEWMAAVGPLPIRAEKPGRSRPGWIGARGEAPLIRGSL